MITVTLVKKGRDDQDDPKERTVRIYEEDYPEGLDLYQLVALRLGWKVDCDPLWFISTKNIERVIRHEEPTNNDVCGLQQTDIGNTATTEKEEK